MANYYKIFVDEYNFYTSNLHKNFIFLRSLKAFFTSPAFRLIVILRIRRFSILPDFLFSNYLLDHFAVDINKNANLGKCLRFAHIPGIVIGSGSIIGDNCILFNGILIGQSHGKYPLIGNNVTICSNASIYGDVKIGDNCIILANSVVTHDIPSNTIAGGIPAKVIKEKGSIKV